MQTLKIDLDVVDGKANIEDVRLDDRPISETERVDLWVQFLQDGSLKEVVLDLDEIDQVTGQLKHFPLQVGEYRLFAPTGLARFLDDNIVDFVDAWDQKTEDALFADDFEWDRARNLFHRTQLQLVRVPGVVRIAASSAAMNDMQLLDNIELVDEAGEPVIVLDAVGNKLQVKIVDVTNDKMYDSVDAFEKGLSHDQYPIEFPAGSVSSFGIHWQHDPNAGTITQRCWRSCYGRQLHESPQQLVIRIEK